MRTAAICPTCATYENAVCVIYNGPTLSNINVPPLTDLQTALGSINASIGSVIALINSVAANPISLTTTGTSGPATLTGNALNVPNYQTGLPYLVYTALLTVNSPGATATVTVLQNTIGDGSGDGINDIAWSGTGPYLATMTAGPFTLNKTTAVPSVYFGSGVNYTLLGVRTSSSVMTFTSRRTDTGASGGAFVSNIFVEIRVYP